MVPKNETVIRQNYLQMLKSYFYPTMQRKRLNNKMIFQQDSAPPHFSKVRTWLNEKFNGRWIGQDSSISWASHSPDSTPLDFFSIEIITLKQKYTKQWSMILPI